MEDEFSTNPEPVAETPAPEVEPEVPESEDGEEPEITEDEIEELEIDGKILRVSKDVKPYLMLHKDYTQKSQANAEEKRQLEEVREAFDNEQQFQQSNMQEIAHHSALQSQMEAYKNLNWQELFRDNPDEANRLDFQYRQLREQSRELEQILTGKRQSWDTSREQQIANARRQAHEALTKPDPGMGWSGKLTPQLRENLTSFAKRIGYTDRQLQNATANDVKLINLAMMGQKTLAAQKQKSTAAGPAAQPVPQAAQGKSRANIDPDKLSTAEWMKHQDQIDAAKHRKQMSR